MSQSQMTEREPPNELETLLGQESGLSRLQLFAIALSSLASLISAFANNEYVFTTGRIPTRCFIPECDNATMPLDFAPDWLSIAVPSTDAGFDNCQRFASAPGSALGGTPATCPATLFDQNTTVGCEQYVYSNTNTAVFTLGLACDEWRRSLLGSARTLGALVSLPVAGAISDRWGRRIALLIVCFNTAWIGTLRVFVTTYIGFVISVFAEAALGQAAILPICYILALEQVPKRYRLRTGTCIICFVAVGQMTLSAIAWAVPDWRRFTLTLYVPQLLALALFWFIPESVRWSLSKGRYAEAKTILRKVAKSRGEELLEKTFLDLKKAAEHEKAKESEMRSHEDPWLVVLVFRHNPILVRALILPVCWISLVLIYYGLSLNAINMSGNMYFNYFIVSMVEIPGFYTPRYFLDWLGRKPVLITAFWVCAVCQTVYIFMPSDVYALSLVVYVIGKFCITVVAASLYVYTSELYPTQYRHRLFGYTSTIGRIGSITAPLTPALGSMVWEPLPFVLFGVVALLSGLLLLLLPETRGCLLPDTMEAAANIGKHTMKKITVHGNDNRTCS